MVAAGVWDDAFPMGYSNLRNGRYSASHCIYALTTITDLRQPWFACSNACQAMREALFASEQKQCLHLLAWVVMPDQVHLLVELNSGVPLSGAIDRLKADAARRINLALGHSGPVWQSGFYDHLLRSDEDLVAQARYLVANPLRAGLVSRIEDYPHWFAVWAPAPFGNAVPIDGRAPCLD